MLRSQPLYGYSSLYVRWYAQSRCKAPGVWTMRFFNNSQEFYSGTFKVLPQIPPHEITPYNQNAYPDDHYDNRCYVAGMCTILDYHGVTVDPVTLDAYINDHRGYDNGDVIPDRVCNWHA